MREFKVMCRDTETNGIMVLSECSYNFACDYLDRKGFVCDDARSVDNRYTEIIGTLNGKAKTFLYDEYRGYLMKMDNGIGDYVGKNILMNMED